MCFFASNHFDMEAKFWFLMDWVVLLEQFHFFFCYQLWFLIKENFMLHASGIGHWSCNSYGFWVLHIIQWVPPFIWNMALKRFKNKPYITISINKINYDNNHLFNDGTWHVIGGGTFYIVIKNYMNKTARSHILVVG